MSATQLISVSVYGDELAFAIVRLLAGFAVDGTTFAGPAFEAAVKTCKLFGGGAAPPPLSASQKQQMVAFAECMRAHGVPNFPDPTFPTGGGVKRSFPAGVVPSSPAFQRAGKACGRGA